MTVAEGTIPMPEQRDEFGQHFSSQFNHELANLRSRVFAMGGVVEQQIADAVAALVARDEVLARSVIAEDLYVNALEIYLDEECRRILARRQPAAGDLRLIFAVIKTVTDIERIGDSAKGVARMALQIIAGEPRGPIPRLQRLGALARDMVQMAINAFWRMDVNLAFAVARADLEVDAEYRSIMDELTELMTDDPGATPWALNLVWAARALERAGDHAKNIAEYLIFLVQGMDVRHVSIEDRERQVQRQMTGSTGS